MTKKNLKPQQAAPVQREINTTSSEGVTGLTPQALNLIHNLGFRIPPVFPNAKADFYDREVKRDLDYFLG
jgi:prenylated cyclic peptide (anacyclamide/piricyclamide family)